MEYANPKIVALDQGLFTIQSGAKSASTMPDNAGQPFLITVSAYEADE